MLYKKPHKDKILLSTGTATHESLPHRFNICVWNLQKCKHRLWERDFLELAGAVDLFLAQEILLKPEVEKALYKTGLHWTTAVSFLSLRDKLPAGIAIGSKTKPISAIFKDAVKEPLFNIPKMTLAALFKIGNTEMLVINVHAINFTGIKSFERNLAQAESIILSFQGPIIIAGDFNTWSAKRLLSIKALAARLNLSEVLFYPDLRTKYFKKPVDYIFAKQLKLKAARAIPAETSDHNPILAEFELI